MICYVIWFLRPAESFFLELSQKIFVFASKGWVDFGTDCLWIGTKKNNDKERNSISPWKRLILRKSQWFDMNSSDFIDHYWPKFRWTHVSVKACNECLTYIVSSAIHVLGKLDEPNFINQRGQNGCSEDLLASLIVHNSNTNAFWLSSCRC